MAANEGDLKGPSDYDCTSSDSDGSSSTSSDEEDLDFDGGSGPVVPLAAQWAGERNIDATLAAAATEAEAADPVAAASHFLRHAQRELVDVFQEIGVGNMGVVDGDALLHHVLASDPTLDVTHGGQPLHVCYKFLRFLHRLLEAHGKITVVFFGARHAMWQQHDFGCLLRCAVLRHLTHCTTVPVREFASDHHGADYATFLMEHTPAYVISSILEPETSDLAALLDPLVSAFLVSSLANSQNIVLLAGHEFTGFRLRASVIWESSHAKKYCIAMPCNPFAVHKASIAVSRHTAWDKCSARDCLTLDALSVLAVQSPLLDGVEDRFLAQIYLLHLTLLPYLPPDRRPCALPSSHLPWDHKVQAFLSSLLAVMAAQIAVHDYDAVDGTLCDPFDGRLLYALLLAITADTEAMGLPDTVHDQWQLLCSLAALGEILAEVPPSWRLPSDAPYQEAVAMAKSSHVPLEALDQSLLETDVIQDLFPEAAGYVRAAAAAPEGPCPSAFPCLNEAKDAAAPDDWETAFYTEGEQEEEESLAGSLTCRDAGQEPNFDLRVAVSGSSATDPDYRPHEHWTTAVVAEGIESNHIFTQSATWQDPYTRGRAMHIIQLGKRLHGLLQQKNGFRLRRNQQRVEDVDDRIRHTRRQLLALKAPRTLEMIELEGAKERSAGRIRRKLIRWHHPDEQLRLEIESIEKFADSLHDNIVQKDVIGIEDKPIGLRQARDTAVPSHDHSYRRYSKKELITRALELLDQMRAQYGRASRAVTEEDNTELLAEMHEMLQSSLSDFGLLQAELDSRSLRRSRDDGITALQRDFELLRKDCCQNLLASMIGRFVKFAMPRWRDVLRVFGFNSTEEKREVGHLLDTLVEISEMMRKRPSKEWLPLLDEGQQLLLCSALCELGFEVDARELLQAVCPHVPQHTVKLATPAGPREPASLRTFQLQSAPELLRRSRGVRDERVRRFMPDAWQRELLNIVDVGESALVCAPTSSGKTFIAFYCIEQVLRERTDGNGLVVYVAPSKALVNQVEADIFARFGKTYAAQADRHLCGVFTAEHRRYETTCQVLITVPACLEILLLHTRQRSFASRLRWIIFDEVHNISCLGGQVWERLLLSCPCPFMALSATVGNPNHFTAWLNAIQPLRKVHLVTSAERFNDLKLYTYPCGGPSVLPLDPALFATGISLRTNGHLTTSSLLPEQTLELFERLRTFLQVDAANHIPLEISRALLERLEQSTQASQLVTGNELLPVLTTIDMHALFQHVQDILVALAKTSEDAANHFLQALPGRAALFEQLDQHDDWGRAMLLQNIMPCLRSLEAKDLLPAIIFHLNITGCDHFAQHIERMLCYEQDLQLLHDQVQRELHNPCSVERAAACQDYLARWNAHGCSALANMLVCRQRGEDGEEGARLWQLVAVLRQRQDDLAYADTGYDTEVLLREVDARFSFTKKAVTLEALQMHLHYWNLTANDVSADWRLRLLRRGVGVHYSEMPRKQKNCVERLFREGKLRVIIATGTLAMGINMPCRTVVLAGNSPYLTPVNFHQMSGRAGRRNFDTRGHVVAMGISRAKLRRLLHSPMPQLIGNPPMTPVLALRLLMRYAEASPTAFLSAFHVHDQNSVRERKEMTRTLRAMMSTPLCAFDAHTGANLLKTQLPHFFLYFVDWLKKNGALRVEGRLMTPTAMCGFLAHLFYLEPNNFVFATALYSNLFEAVVDKYEPNADGQYPHELHEKLLVVLSHFVFPRYLSGHKDVETRRAGTQCQVVLPPLPSPELQQHLSRFNTHVLRAFTTYARHAAQQLLSQVNRNVLPLGTCLPAQSLPAENVGPLITKLQQLRLVSEACSPFVAVSGQTDVFPTPDIFLESCDHRLHMDRSMVPVCILPPEGVHLSARIIDFFNTRNKDWIAQSHDLKVAVQYEHFRLVKHTLKVITEAIRRRSAKEPARQRVFEAFSSTSRAFDEVFRSVYSFHDRR